MTFESVRKLFKRAMGSLHPFNQVGWSDGTLAGGRSNSGIRPGLPPGSALGDWLTQTVTYHH
jgi:hypothetical protein